MLFVATAFVLESDALKAVAVILIGCSALVLAALGKPKQTPVDLTDRLLHLLPTRLWQAAMALIGVVIITVGAFELG